MPPNNVYLKTFLLEDLSEPELYDDLVYKFRKIVGKNLSKNTQEMPRSRRTALPRYQKKRGTNNDKTNSTYEPTDAQRGSET